MKTIVAIDDSPCSKALIKEIERRKWHKDDHIKIMSVIENCLACGGSDDATDEGSVDSRTKHVRQLCEKAARLLEKHKCQVELNIISGDAVVELLAAAESWHADKIILGTHGHSVCPHNLQRSVSHLVEESAKCEVEVVA